MDTLLEKADVKSQVGAEVLNDIVTLSQEGKQGVDMSAVRGAILAIRGLETKLLSETPSATRDQEMEPVSPGGTTAPGDKFDDLDADEAWAGVRF